MSYPFIPSYVRLGRARGPRLAIVWHMAEGGGTVNYLSKENPHGVSVHFVIEYSGRIVQMLPLDEAHTSIRIKNPNGSLALRSTTETVAPYYGAAARRLVMGDWADIAKTLGPNHASIAVEIEGFAATGPNAAQRGAMAALQDDLQRRFPSLRGGLGHRDFNVKTCPGTGFPFAVIGGHGLWTDTGDNDMRITRWKTEDWRPTVTGGQSNGVVRLVPDVAAPIIHRFPAGTVIRTGQEIRTGAATDYDWRVIEIEYDGQLVPGYMLRRDLTPLVQGGDPKIEQLIHDLLARKNDDANATIAQLRKQLADEEAEDAAVAAQLDAIAADLRD